MFKQLNLSNQGNRGNTGYLLGVFGVVLTLIWIGIYKFTPTEAKLIEPLIANSPLFNWLLSIFSIQIVSNIIGLVEILVALGLIWGLFNPKVAVLFGLISIGIFLSTLSFLITTPGLWKISDGIIVTNFFMVKDIVFLAISISVIERNWHFAFSKR